ncbi:AMP-binding protein [Verrucomicrobiaceae bacterium 5K15]|uniref:AMP-binding protein n=1 Tax=Oceaniferula flava TaxID=2800421 RepID=A0AAE2S9D0_9BACT|nr:AMP-binding protein [Oceaniferula flavus]MBK1853418.1 AMP-binding protein [Oceaniferula flavus]MBM1134723.1 AMP-binding protein [Oceaniferula flavus]
MSKNIEILGKEHIPSEGALVIPGRLDFHEMLHLEQIFAGRAITWICEENVVLDDAIRSFLERDGITAVAFSADDAAPETIGDNLRDKLQSGGVLIYLAGQVCSTSGDCCHITAPILRQLCALGLPVLPVAVSKPSEIASAPENTAKLPSSIFSFRPVIPGNEVTPATWRQALLEADEIAFSSRSFLNGSLPLAILSGLKKHGSTTKLYDGTDDSELAFDRILAAAIAFSGELKQMTKKKRVGIILPPGKGGMVANLAVLFAGKIPVNLNFTASHAAVQSSIRQADIDKFITADPFVRKVSSFPWPPNRDLIFIERSLPALKKKIIRWVVLTKILPVSVIAKILGLGNSSGDDEAVLLFTSGSSGEPKGVPLSHRNVLANVCQFGSRICLGHHTKILGCLPLFHSFGSTVTLWYPCIEGVNLVTYPSPLETKRLAELIEMHSVNMLLSTPTFLRGYMRRVKAEQLQSLDYVVTGAEKLPESLATAFKEKFGILPLEGYGLTETSPATNVNLPTPEQEGQAPVIDSNRFGSVGKFLPGMAVKMTNPATGKPSPIDHQGTIWLRGANIFPGYLGDEKKTAEVIKDGWFNTGDIGRIDDDGFLYIEGRLSRFSKIAGEMVPHETVEAAITKVLGLDQETERKIAVVGIPDEQKGEAIALLTTVCGDTLEQECIDLRYKLMDQGLPSLWCPKSFIPTDEIPILASGKLDIKACQQLAES